jgi:hypothetical protein
MEMASRMKNDSLPKASLSDSVAFMAEVFAPVAAKGVIIRRPRMVGMAEKLDLDPRSSATRYRTDGTMSRHA